MASYNRVILVGNLTRDPELKYIPSGTAVAELGLAVNDRRKTASGDWIEETTFVDVTLWARNAEVASEYTTKGSQVLIEGRLKLDTWEKEGKKHSKLRVVGERLVMLGSKGGGGGGAARGGSPAGARPRPASNSAASNSAASNSGPSFDEPDYSASENDYSGGGSSGGDDIPF